MEEVRSYIPKAQEIYLLGKRGLMVEACANKLKFIELINKNLMYKKIKPI